MRLEPGTWPLSHLCFLPMGPPVISGGQGDRFETCPRLCGSSSFSSVEFCETIRGRFPGCPGMEALSAHPHRSLYIITSFGGKRASGLIRWHFVSGDWNRNLPNHLLVFSIRVILVHMKPQPAFCLEPVTLPVPFCPHAQRGLCTLCWVVACPISGAACSKSEQMGASNPPEPPLCCVTCCVP